MNLKHQIATLRGELANANKKLKDIKEICEDYLDYDTEVLHRILHIIDPQ